VNTVRIGLAVLVGSSWALSPARVDACGLAPGAQERAAIDHEGALIVWDSAHRIEHFVRSAVFESTGHSFGFLVPTPARPTLADADTQVFQALLDITLPPIKDPVQWLPRFVGITEPWLLEMGILQYRVGGGRRDVITIVEEKTVGGLDATVLLASDTSALANWLGTHGFDLRPALQQWLGVYVAKGWYIVALRYDKPDAIAKVASRAVRITFPTDQPIYPYREPADTAERPWRRLDLFVVAEGRVDGVLSDATPTPWGARPTFAAPAALTSKLTAALPGVELPANAWVSEFVDDATKRVESDVIFRASDSTVEVRKPPAIGRPVKFYPVPYELPFVFAPLAWWWWRVGARKRATTRRG
jgi:hypothetical protein